MKPFILFGLGWVALSAAWAGPERARVDAPAMVPPSSIVPIATDMGEPRGGTRLREVLRQPFDTSTGPGQPYRLSDEERLRLREQLRGHQFPDRSIKP
jgi:hypothetical protein